jgi:hypothetical protein
VQHLFIVDVQADPSIFTLTLLALLGVNLSLVHIDGWTLVLHRLAPEGDCTLQAGVPLFTLLTWILDLDRIVLRVVVLEDAVDLESSCF